MKQHRLINILLVLFSLLPLIYLAVIWQRVSPLVALHFNSHMEPDKLESKEKLWFPVAMLAGTSILVLFLLQNIKWLDPKRRDAPDSPVFNKLAAGILVFMTVLNFLLITASYKGSTVLDNFLFPLLGLLFAFIGNYMHNVKPNYFAGFRLPWTLSDDENWRLTHRLAGKLWFWGGMTLAIVALLIPANLFFPVFVTTVIVLSLVPTIYSYLLFRNKH